MESAQSRVFVDGALIGLVDDPKKPHLSNQDNEKAGSHLYRG